ncbi:MAG: acyltransferase family protein [Candidatus Azobacteroides sp.]|nr:acyltransferase family protein [Candidatus Azobacteroides sp.]
MERNVRIDRLRVVLSFLIIAIHANLCYEFGDAGNEVGGFTRIAVPLFLVISGYYFYNVYENKKGIIKYLKHIVSLYVIWMILYLPFYFNVSTPFEIKRFFLTLLIGYNHLWYLPALIGGVLVFLFLNKFRFLGKYTFIVCAFVLYLIGLGLEIAKVWDVVPSGVKLVLSWNFPYRNFLFFGYPFFVLGFLVRQYEGKITQLYNQTIWVILTVLFLCLLPAEVYLYNTIGLSISGTDMFLSLFFLCPLIFIWNVKHKKTGKSKNLADLSSGIYFIHPMFILLIDCFHMISSRPLYIFLMAAVLSIIGTKILMIVNKKWVRIL